MTVLGIDIGGSGIKGALVDLEKGELMTDRYRIPTPEMAKPQDVADVFAAVVRHFDWNGPVGCGFPAVIHHGTAWSAANIHESWIGTNANELFSAKTGCPVYTVNDADAAGIAEMRYGVGKQYQQGLVILLTLGTGIGSALFMDGRLVPNTELGHLEIRGKDAERRASDAVRKAKEWSYKKWAKRLQEYLDTVERLFSPDVIIVGGGVSKEAEEFLPYLKTRAILIPAQLRNQAGIIGAALYASQQG